RQRLWPADTFVDFDHSLNVSINKLRQVLDDDADNPRFVATAGRRGYRFIAPVGGPGQMVAEKPIEASLPPGASKAAMEESSPDNSQVKPQGNRKFPKVAAFVMILLTVATVAASWRYLHPRPPLSPRKIMLAVLPL